MPAPQVATDIEMLLKGAIAGIAISAPVGPVNVLCISRTITGGRRGGIMSGLGAAAADTIYGAIAGFGITLVIGFLLRELFWIRLFGGMLLMGIGVLYFFKKPRSLRQQGAGETAHSDFVTAFLLNLTNPTVVLSFLAVLAALGLHRHKSPLQSLLLVGGIFAGAMLWWSPLTMVTSHFRDRFDDHAMFWMNRIAGGAIGTFGVVTLILAFTASR